MPFDKKACDKAYREANKEKLAAQNKAWREANKDKIKAYREANKDKRNAQGKAWREANKDRQKKIGLTGKKIIEKKLMHTFIPTSVLNRIECLIGV